MRTRTAHSPLVGRREAHLPTRLHRSVRGRHAGKVGRASVSVLSTGVVATSPGGTSNRVGHVVLLRTSPHVSVSSNPGYISTQNPQGLPRSCTYYGPTSRQLQLTTTKIESMPQSIEEASSRPDSPLERSGIPDPCRRSLLPVWACSRALEEAAPDKRSMEMRNALS